MIAIDVKAGHAHKQRDDAVVLALLDGRKLTESGKALQQETGKQIPSFLRKFDHSGDFGVSGTLYDLEGTFTQRVVFFGAGDEKKLTLQKLRQLASKAARSLQQSGARDVSFYFSELGVRGATVAEKVQALAEGVWLGLYTFDKYQTKKKENNRDLRSITLMVPSRRDLDECEAAVARAKAIASGTNFARDLANEPGNVCTPEFLGDQAAALVHDKLKVTVMDKAAIEKAGFTALLAVNQGSAKEPRFIVLDYQGGQQADAPVALVGKGLTFDAGGISIKPAAQMDEMKFDMCGSAAVLGIFKAAIEMNLPINLLGVIASTENLLGAAAYKPGDIVTSYKGVTIEVLNTDAEGRIILSDALAYAAEQKPAEIIDFATLTGACVIALGAQASGLLGTGEDVIKGLEKSGEYTYDRVWRLPLFEEYQEQIKSQIADIKNTGGREAGTITAACFLSRFVDDIPWAHLDIAGTAWDMKGTDISPVGATGAGVRLLIDYLCRKL
ncbi:MAG: leucyl aminopeptidase [Zetaproteobacteria bacterium CG_4_9_14_3_um_filter_49_83]|nr:MAG: leucyl aminopeptidase [Zetaproteobacteria bacterium CG1_02_49_23]PIQ33967.1 MAG: leucyl aminopeptidase [Zetaproteobacteria bacterium CG17_big_fil_post_rev_8_21_14_2_50_50_13]PIV31117.1 MAG: leucyl aminopeptidase [Zetaproteobacteria bacterium CG02_land_8_20_14_3_00_50_9]PIY56748.1 MAG: leucyl aminopeptidase [Zetaproteobacteria bacterium CG_4_10_14_0_8_um_filter_49_80]PJA35968.1 MAG: leucyl aminopeptidase [Zetaproteobacteria bacterium CG_4_9_14_3_um_filter_49_83]